MFFLFCKFRIQKSAGKYEIFFLLEKLISVTKNFSYSRLDQYEIFFEIKKNLLKQDFHFWIKKISTIILQRRLDWWRLDDQ